MITLLIDGLIAAVKTIDRAFTAVENVRFRGAPRPVETHTPTGAGRGCAASAGPGGHPFYRTTSALLEEAATTVDALGSHKTNLAGWLLDGLVDELRDRAAQFAAIND